MTPAPDPADDGESLWPPPGHQAKAIAQAQALTAQAQDGGLRFEVFLPSGLAEWMLGMVEAGTFLDPGEAAFVMFGEQKELSAHPDLRRELLSRSLQAAIADPRPGIPHEELMAKMKERLSRPLAEPATWQKIT